MKSSVKTKITISRNTRNGDLEVWRNGIKELSIKGASLNLDRHLRMILLKERDYEEFIKFWGLPEGTHLGSWLINYIPYADRDILDEFKKVVVIPR